MSKIEAGDTVRFLNKNGRSGERDFAAEQLDTDTTYLVRYVDEGSWHTDIYLVGLSDGFNSVMFEVVK